MKEGKERAVARVMLRTLFSTTLRVFGPVMAGFLIGLIVDLNLATKPWGMSIGVVVGVVVAAILVVRQLVQIRKSTEVASLLQEEK